MFPWPARAPYLSLIEHIWEIIGRQLQRHPQALTVLYLPTKCNRHGTPSHKLRSGTGKVEQRCWPIDTELDSAEVISIKFGKHVPH
uniref:Tc1-like transposase DDE domain-containing protein n=1 Tax=Araneus ventricosus TaxID=182803 RepID=A0A4Y2BA46_ARAVE|nr:hypothetical protein AVEN_92074-1 [Araneus ventricosus]